jgi:hypothetical protein
MDARTFEARMRDYAPTSEIEQELALQEMLQSIVLAALSRSGFFKSALFHGGTCLRLIHGLARFSEDLDFLLKQADPDFIGCAWPSSSSARALGRADTGRHT